MTLTIACYTAQAFDAAGYETVNHEMCQRKGGLIAELPESGFGTIARADPCSCHCHEKQERHIPTRSRYEGPYLKANRKRTWNRELVDHRA